MSAPDYPWKKGQTPVYSMVVLEVEVCLDSLKHVYSSHRPQAEADQELLMMWPGGGQEHVAFALLAEATKREAIFSMLLNMSNKPGFIEHLESLSEEERDKAFGEIAMVVLDTMGKNAQQIAKAAVAAAFEDVREG